jgi:hypothetical protein
MDQWKRDRMKGIVLHLMFPSNCNADAVLAMIIDECIEIRQLSEMH